MSIGAERGNETGGYVVTLDGPGLDPFEVARANDWTTAVLPIEFYCAGRRRARFVGDGFRVTVTFLGWRHEPSDVYESITSDEPFSIAPAPARVVTDERLQLGDTETISLVGGAEVGAADVAVYAGEVKVATLATDLEVDQVGGDAGLIRWTVPNAAKSLIGTDLVVKVTSIDDPMSFDELVSLPFQIERSRSATSPCRPTGHRFQRRHLVDEQRTDRFHGGHLLGHCIRPAQDLA
ncbi:MAG: hypothetical protein R2705_22545 [Ilumatobacteraceae bacterium]